MVLHPRGGGGAGTPSKTNFLSPIPGELMRLGRERPWRGSAQVEQW